MTAGIMNTHRITPAPMTASDQGTPWNTNRFRIPQVAAEASTTMDSRMPRSFLFTVSTWPFSFGKGVLSAPPGLPWPFCSICSLGFTTGVLHRGHSLAEASSSTPQFTQYDISFLSAEPYPARQADRTYVPSSCPTPPVLTISASGALPCLLHDSPAEPCSRLLSILTWMPSCTSLRKNRRSTSASTMLLAKFTVRTSSKLMMAQLVLREKGWPM